MRWVISSAAFLTPMLLIIALAGTCSTPACSVTDWLAPGLKVVTAMVPGHVAPSQIGQIQIACFINPGGLDPKGENLFAETASSGTPAQGAPGANGLGQLTQGSVETSNVNVVEELVSMIQTQRAYEINSKAVQASDQMLQRLTQLCRSPS